MKSIGSFLDSTYLKTSAQSGLSEQETWPIIENLAQEAIRNTIFSIMIRPEFVARAKQFLQEKNSTVKVGTVIGFHEGTASTEDKIREAEKAIQDGTDELDFVINFQKYLQGDIPYVEQEFRQCTVCCLANDKIIKWIIEIAALSDEQIADISDKISSWANHYFPGKEEKIFIKSSTGFYRTENGKPNGATFEGIKIMLKNAGKLPVKAAGGVKTKGDAQKMIEMGVQRIGTSSAATLLTDESTDEVY